MGIKDKFGKLKSKLNAPKVKTIKEEYYVIAYTDKAGRKRKRTAKTYAQAEKIAKELASKGYEVEVSTEARVGKITSKVSTTKILKEKLNEGLKELAKEEKKSKKKKGGKKKSRKTKKRESTGFELDFFDSGSVEFFGNSKRKKKKGGGLPDLL